MPREVRDIIRDLDRLELVGDYMTKLYELSDEFEASADPAVAVEPVLRFIERNGDKDLGAPGPLVHFLETVPGYEAALLRSLERIPTDLTVWMLNRIVNVAEGDDRTEHLALMRRIAESSTASQDARNAALRFLHHQEEGRT